MGAEGSTLQGDREPEQIVLQVPGQSHNGSAPASRAETPGDRERSSAASQGTRSERSSAASKPSAGPGWMRVSQVKASTPTEVRQALPRQPTLKPKRSTAGTPPAPEEPVDPAAAAAEAEYKQRLENSKRELVKKLAVQIKSVQLKDLASLQPARVPVAKQSAKSADAKRSWLSKLTKNKAAALANLDKRAAQSRYLEPMTQEEVGDRVEGSLGGNLEQFGSFQGALHDIMQAGVTDEVLDQFFFDEEEERVLPTYQKWQIIRHAAEQVLAVYANRSNSQWIEDEAWGAPSVVNTTAAASVYSNTVDAELTQGGIALLFIDDGRLAETGGDEVSPLLATDLWQAIKELAPGKVPSGQRLERLSVAGRHLLHAAVSVEMWYGAAALKQIKVVLAIDCDCEYFVVNELAQWNFFGLEHSNVVLLPLPRFHGFAQDMRSGHLAHVKGSPRLMLGTGYAMFLLNSPAEAYTLSADGMEPQCLQGSVLDWLNDSKAAWLYTGLFSDVERLRPEALFDMDFLAAGLAAAERRGANMALEVILGEHEREARTHDSLVLSRLTRNTSPRPANGPTSASGAPSGASRPASAGPPSAAARPASASASGAAGAAASVGGTPPPSRPGTASAPSNCNLRVSSMRTVKSYKLLQTTATSPHGFYIGAHRYVFSTRALQRMLVDPAAFHADVYLQGFYAYATFDISDLTTFREAHCACIMGTQGLRAPVMSEVIYGKDWLSAAATILQLQDNVKEFRRKAMQLYDQTRTAGARGPTGPMRSSTFKEKRGYTVLLVLTPEHGRMLRAAMRMARLFIHNIADRLHVVLVAGEGESKTRVRELYDSLGDKELEFHSQLVREVVVRPAGSGVADTVAGLLPKLRPHMVVVPSERLCLTGTSADLGQLAGSCALSLARAITSIPVLIVKANTVGKYVYVPSSLAATAAAGAAGPAGAGGGGGMTSRNSSSALAATAAASTPPGGRDVVLAMVHLDTTSVGPLVEYVSSALAGGTDALVLARTGAMEKDGALSMRSRRVFVQARMAVAQALRVEERAYAGSAAAELPKAVEAESVDLLALSCAPDLAISKDMEQLLQLCRTSILIHRPMTQAPTAAGAAWS